MSILTLNQALDRQKPLIGFVCQGIEEVAAYAQAARDENQIAVLMIGPNARKFIPLNLWGEILKSYEQSTQADVVFHLDHGQNFEEIQMALDVGFSSVMYDGSLLPIKDNIENTQKMVRLAQKYGASTEGEIGIVGYANGAISHGTDPKEAEIFAYETAVDMMAISIGNTHLQEKSEAQIDWARLEAIARATPTPLVIHGGSGIAHQDRMRMAQSYNVQKFNIGTQLRQVFGQGLRENLAQNPQEFDHIAIMNPVIAALKNAARELIRMTYEEARPEDRKD